MIKIAICDQDEKCCRQVIGFCEKFFENTYVDCEIKQYISGKSLLLEDFPDVLFLNVETRDIDGLLIKEILYKMHAETRIIFIAEQFEKISVAFGKNVYAFLKKPIQWNSFYEHMKRMVHDVLDDRKVVYCKYKEKVEKIYLREIKYIKAYGKYTKIYVQGKKEYRLSDYSFAEWYLEMENTEFACCHRGYLVNIFYIKTIGKDIELLDEVHIPMGKKKKEEFYRAYDTYMECVKAGKSI